MTTPEPLSVCFHVLTVYPDMFASFLSEGLIGKAINDKKLIVELVDFRENGIGKHNKVDAPPYGGGAGMVLRPEPIFESLTALDKKASVHKILISPQGQSFNQQKAIELSKKEKPIALVCGRFEGFDERIRSLVDEEISLGDFVMMGGEIAAMAIVESVARLIPGVIGNQESLTHESFSQDLLEYSQYTRPIEFNGIRVPDVLTSGNHQEIEKWRLKDAERKTRMKRSDLYERYLQRSESSDI
ncbi:MAG: tRNA (guanosine(37)-N1)-methyltransferase TrmD [Proteobacteria bacterium]|nr:tRNA (guanosine(37)-N1)-methyltransferase TrmD [Pseudomonadota bacterium]